MLVLVSDLHVTDETTANNVNPEAFALLGDEILDAAARRGAREIHLVLLGDILDLVRSDFWHRHAIPMAERPWGGRLDPRTAMNSAAETVEAQFRAILAAALASPAGTALAGMLARLSGATLPLTVTYVIGNHERVMWNFPSLQEDARRSLPQISAFASRVERLDYGVLARHGHEWDEPTHGWRLRREVLMPAEPIDRFSPEAYRTMAIGEAVTAELMSGLVFHARDAGAPPELIDQLKDVNNLRPLLDVFGWLEWIGGARGRTHQAMLHQALRRSLDGLLDSSLARAWDRLQADLLLTGDLVDRLEQARALLLGPDFDSFRGRVEWLQRLQRLLPAMLPGDDAVYAGAGAEAAFSGAPAPGGIEHVIYGHTHRARHDYLAASAAGAVQLYVNTGTFLPLISRTRDRTSFASEQQLTMVFAYRADEDLEGKVPGTTSLDIWNGARRKRYAVGYPAAPHAVAFRQG
jgi:UDP-2,3-diacylglucosamine pyrophosphatase LpxH